MLFPNIFSKLSSRLQGRRTKTHVGRSLICCNGNSTKKMKTNKQVSETQKYKQWMQKDASILSSS